MVTKILKFGAEWCGPCRVLHKTLQDPAFKDLVEEIDVDDNEELADKYNIKNIPVLVFLNEDKNEMGRLVGAVTSKVIQSKISELNG